MIKAVEFPLELILLGLKSSEPKYIAVGGVRVSLYDVAAGLITSLLSQADEAESEKREAYALLEKTFTNPPHWAAQSNAGIIGQDLSRNRKNNTDGGTKETVFPAATVIAAIVKQTAI
jgi:hypothetical protein